MPSALLFGAKNFSQQVKLKSFSVYFLFCDVATCRSLQKSLPINCGSPFSLLDFPHSFPCVKDNLARISYLLAVPGHDSYTNTVDQFRARICKRRRWALPIEFRYSDIRIANGLRKTYRNVGLT